MQTFYENSSSSYCRNRGQLLVNRVTVEVEVPVYQLEIPLAASATANPLLGLDASGLTIAQRNTGLAEEFTAAVESQVDSAHVYDYFSWIAELLRKGATPLVQPLLESATPLLRYFAADRLAQMNDAAGQNVLLAILNDRGQASWMRANAAWDLGKLHATRVLPDLAKFATDDPEAAVREGALWVSANWLTLAQKESWFKRLTIRSRRIAFLPQPFWRRSSTGKTTPLTS